jgi:hypothetical protein
MKMKNILSVFLKIIVPLIMMISIIMLYCEKKVPYENGRYFDNNTGVVYLEQSLLIYKSIAIICGIIIVLFVLSKIKFKK